MNIDRSCAVLMPVASLPSPYGIGTLGQAAYDFVDFLSSSNQSWWQMLPLGPTSYGDSPYQSFSSYAGNPYFIDFDFLIEDGLLTKEFVESFDWGSDRGRIDYEKVYQSRYKVLRCAFENGFERDREKFSEFERESGEWLKQYALYMSLKDKYGSLEWTRWPDKAVRRHEDDAVRAAFEELSDDVAFYEYIQFLFFEQWKKLRAYAREKGIGIIGDVPIYVALDSADVWSEPHYFQLDPEGKPENVAGVPPDYFSESGQLWGNPLYEWDAMKADGYGWWIRRIDGAAKLYDIIRIDHFRGFESYWSVPADEDTAKNGKWVKGPGIDFVHVLTSWFGNIQFIAEDLGILTQEVRQLLKDSTLPGMKVLQFAFDWREPSNYLPHTYNDNCVCYMGTHDNNTIVGWLSEADKKDLKFAREYLGVSKNSQIPLALIRAGMMSVSELFVVQMQDVLGLDETARINTPGTVGGNWVWRIDENYKDKLMCDLAELTRIYGRSNPKWIALHSTTNFDV